MKNEPYYGGIILLIFLLLVSFFLRLPYIVGADEDKPTASTQKSSSVIKKSNIPNSDTEEPNH